MAVKLSKAFEITVDIWVREQVSCNTWKDTLHYPLQRVTDPFGLALLFVMIYKAARYGKYRKKLVRVTLHATIAYDSVYQA